MNVHRSGIAVHAARFGIWIVILGRRLLFRTRSHLVCISLARRSLGCVYCGRATFEVRKLLHPC